MYGFHGTVPDTQKFIVGLWTFAAQYVARERITPAWKVGYDACKSNPNKLPSFRNNFEIASFPFFKRKDVANFIEAIDRDGGIYRVRW